MTSLPYYSGTFAVIALPLAIAYSFVAHLVLAIWKRKPLVALLQPIPNKSSVLSRRLVAIVTGSNTGIGFETARRLAVEYDMTVILACRSREKGEMAIQEIQRQGGKGAVFLHPLDLSSSKSICEFTEAFKSRFNEIHILINNAGRALTGDPVEGNRDVLFQTNFLGHFELTALLMDRLAAQARVVNLSSVLHHFTQGNVNEESFWASRIEYSHIQNNRYAASKLAAILFTKELNRRFGDRIQSVVVNPGAVNSDIWRDFPRFLIPVFEIIYLNNYQGSQTSVAAALCDWRHLRSDSSSTDMVYLQPYYQLFAQRKGEPLFPSLELVGVFGGHLSATPRLPRHDGGLQAAKALWTASLNATNAKWPDSS